MRSVVLFDEMSRKLNGGHTFIRQVRPIIFIAYTFENMNSQK